ncbi:MAG: DNA phosphorothioation system sulfurtransferase DndC [Parvibaculum sp.]|nr:DNA phosphorothioation system sulfurtransferase DndC [Parvibaculum sp.]
MGNSLEDRVSVAIQNTQALYLSDSLPWVIGYSGGKDSSATLQLVWNALSAIPKEKRTKPVYVISTDTLVENPVVAIWVQNSLTTMKDAAERQDIPIHPQRLMPALKDRFWVNLIGRGYPAPRPMFRWCTSRLKISASTKFITEVADKHGEAILVLGSRKAESAARDKVLAKYENSTRELLSRNSDASLDRVWIYTPISSWTSDDVWEYLITYENPWGYDNTALFHMYKGASPDAECPLVVDKSTPSCGDSRFGCFVCTMVSEDKSMQAMIQNDDEKKWMAPLLTFRNNFLKTEGDRVFREFTRMDGALTLHYLDEGKGKEFPSPSREVDVETKKGDRLIKERKHAVLVHGPYTQMRREELLSALLRTQREVDDQAPPSVGKFELISMEEIEEIRRLWVHQKHEFEDSVPRIYEEALGRPYPVAELDESTPFRPDDMILLRDICEKSSDHSAGSEGLTAEYLHFRTLRDLLHIQHSYRNAIRRVGLSEKLDKALESGSFMSELEALEFALKGRESVAQVELLADDPFLQPAEVLAEEPQEELEK